MECKQKFSVQPITEPKATPIHSTVGSKTTKHSYAVTTHMFKCTTCGKKFSFKTTLNKHLREKHKPKQIIVTKPKIISDTDSLECMIAQAVKNNSADILSKLSQLTDIIHQQIQPVEPTEPIDVNNNKPVHVRATKPRKLKIPTALKDEVWFHYIGNNAKALCWCCNKIEIRLSSFHAGHVISEANGGKVTLENLRPVCSRCNGGMATKNMYDYGSPFTDSMLNKEQRPKIL